MLSGFPRDPRPVDDDVYLFFSRRNTAGSSYLYLKLNQLVTSRDRQPSARTARKSLLCWAATVVIDHEHLLPFAKIFVVVTAGCVLTLHCDCSEQYMA